MNAFCALRWATTYVAIAPISAPPIRAPAASHPVKTCALSGGMGLTAMLAL
jgi:hypothetical protein